MDKFIIYCSPIKSKQEYGKAYAAYSHNCGIKLLQKAFLDTAGIEITEDMIKKSPSGKPYIENTPYCFSISHCDGLAVCALSEYETGVDCERIRAVKPRVIKRCYNDTEAEYIRTSGNPDGAFTALWTLKESYVKMTGEGVSAINASVCFDLDSERALFSAGAEFYCRRAFDSYYISLCLRNDGIKKCFIENTYFNIDNDYILLYNILDN